MNSLLQSNKTLVYQTEQIREFERLAQERFGIASSMMMQRAGKAAFDFLIKRWPQAQRIAVFCGGGNNGGDGYVLAKLANERGLRVTIWQVGSQDKMKSEAKDAFEACKQAKIDINQFQDKIHLEHTDLIVDAICGIGLSTPLRGDIIPAIEKIQRSHLPVFSLDIPSGINADTGQLLGAAIRATATMTFIGLKLGLVTGNGIAYTGELIVSDLQFPIELFSYVEAIAERIQVANYSNYLKPRSRDWHKGLSGHVLIIGGELGFSGAPRMAAEAALRVGAGLVTVATRPENAIMMNITCPEIMCSGITNENDLIPLVAKADVVILGPGLGQSAWAQAIFDYVCAQELPLLIDADGLNLLSKTDKVRDNWVLTPHPGEAARLLALTAGEVQQDRLAAIKAINKRYGGTCVLKGAGSMIFAPNSPPAICDKGNPGMASAGMGDVLSGVIGGLLAQGIPLGDAAKLGVCMHALAGDMAAKEGERGLVAMDLMPFLRRVSNINGFG